jgi:predicted dehydrogenase
VNNRRNFLKTVPLAAGAMAAAAQEKPVRVAILGTGNRGGSLMRTSFRYPWIEIAALCDVNPATAEGAQAMVTKAGRPNPFVASGKLDSYKAVLDRKDIDAVIIATPWQFHVPMALYAMKAGKAVGIEVPAAQTVEECWALLDTQQQTGSPCMMLENWSFRRDNLAVLNMIRQGLLGEIVHCHAAHGNDCVNRIPWYFERNGNARWGGQYLVDKNRDQYPTHSLGPVLSWMNINCGDAFDTILTITSRSLGINHFFSETLGNDHPAATRHYAQGDVATSIIKTRNGNTIVLNNDMQLPRPYDSRWMIQGTEGVYSEERSSIYLWRRSPKEHEWEPFAPYQEKYDHPWWKPQKRTDGKDQLAAGHGGTDPLMLFQFLSAVRDKRPLPLDLFDSLAMSVVVALSEKSVAANGAPVSFPDFTRGAWKTRKPYFADAKA